MTMQRRKFMGVTLPALLGAALTGRDRAHALGSSPTVEPDPPLVLGPDEGLTPEPLLVAAETGRAKLRRADCRGQVCLFHSGAPPVTGRRRHVHWRQDEWV